VEHGLRTAPTTVHRELDDTIWNLIAAGDETLKFVKQGKIEA